MVGYQLVSMWLPFKLNPPKSRVPWFWFPFKTTKKLPLKRVGQPCCFPLIPPTNWAEQKCSESRPFPNLHPTSAGSASAHPRLTVRSQRAGVITTEVPRAAATWAPSWAPQISRGSKNRKSKMACPDKWTHGPKPAYPLVV